MEFFADRPIIGHEKITDFLAKSLANDRLAHAYLFLGPEQVGKATTARWFLSRIFSLSGQNYDPERLAIHPDMSFVARETDAQTGELKSHISIEQIRNLRERLCLSSFANGYKAALIEDADYLTIEAGNAGLKTLEEPTPRTVIVLTAADETRLPATIGSRCQVLRFGLVKDEQITSALMQKGIDQEKAREIVAVSFGRPGLALNYFVDVESLRERAGAVSDFQRLLTLPLSARLKYAADNLPKGSNNRETVLEKFVLWEQVLRERLLTAVTKTDAVVLNETRRVAAALKNLHLGRRALLANVNPQLILENFLIHL